MNLEDEFRCMVGAYYGIREMDEYDLKVYALHDVEEYIRNFIKITPIPNFDYEENAINIDLNISLKTKLQDSLIILNRMNYSMELILLVKKRLRKIRDKELR